MTKFEPSQWIVGRRNKEEEQYYLDLLKKHFEDVTTFEQHPDAMIGLIWSRTFDEVCGKNFDKERVAKRKQKAIEKKLLQKLRSKYGRWINFTNLKFKSVGHVTYRTNFNRVYKIKDYGTLYGSPNYDICSNIFLTSHCLERFEERVPPETYEPITENLKKDFKADPTSADVMVGLILSSNKEYALKDNYCYLNIRVGVLILENLDEIFIAKTFYTPDMLNEMKWVQPLLNDQVELDSFADLLNLDKINIKEPKFLDKELAELLLDLLVMKEMNDD